MHEMSLCESVIQIIEDAAVAQSFEEVKAVWVEIGCLSCVEVSSLTFCFEIARQQTIARNAALHVVEVPAHAWCEQCEKTIEIKQRFDPCPHCEGHQLNVTSGDEMKIKELEVA